MVLARCGGDGAWGAAAYGRKLHDELGRLDTRVKISEIRRCWTAVSCGCDVCVNDLDELSAATQLHARRVPAGCRTWSGVVGHGC